VPDKRPEAGRHLTDQMATALSLTLSPTSSDSDAPKRAQPVERSVETFEALYRAHSPRVYALCLRLTADEGKARELTQDVFVQAWKALPEFRGDANITTWLHRIAVNAMLMERRTERRRLARVSLADDSSEDEAARDLQGSIEGPDVASAIDLERAIATLPPGVRRAFVLHDVEGYTHEEIATMTGLAAGTLRAQVHRARQLLMRMLQ
jgi:RNA polymerase sigma factor (sigma-70 family)